MARTGRPRVPRGVMPSKAQKIRRFRVAMAWKGFQTVRRWALSHNVDENHVYDVIHGRKNRKLVEDAMEAFTTAVYAEAGKELPGSNE